MKVLFIGADPQIAEQVALSIQLRWLDTVPLVAATAADGLEKVKHASPDVIVLRPDFSDLSLTEAIQSLRRFSSVPLLVLSHQGDAMEVITALDTGADAYIHLPFDFTEMTVRISALIRRAAIGMSREREIPLISGPLFLNPVTQEVYLDRQRLSLTSTEFRLLYLLISNRGLVIPRATLVRTLWGDDIDSTDLVKKYIQRLRRKLGDNALEPRWIVSVHGVGYRFIGPASEGGASGKAA